MDVNLSEMNTKVIRLELEIKALKEKERINYEYQRTINDLALLVNTLTTNVTHMLDAQKDQGLRITNLEKKPLENAMYYKRLIVGSFLTTGVGIVIATLIAINV